ncbi:MAG: ABC transporter substrate-binding protein, partial [Eubacteriales bacterium]|nr:ABC transporter substrate-binding protein [Eubacteriales bacterium]
MKFRRVLALALVGCMAFSANVFAEGETTEITMWTYPVGDWGNAEVMDGLIATFNEAHPEISVKVEYLDYTNGDDQVNTAIEGGQAPDIVFEGPE